MQLIDFKISHPRLNFPQIDLSLQNGEIVSLMGASGCGKSTLLQGIAGHLSAEYQIEGQIRLQHSDRNVTTLPAHQRGIGILFQHPLLFPHLNVWQNLAFAIQTGSATEKKQQAFCALESLGLQDLAEQGANQVSGGQAARISLLRTLLAKPKALLLDEPFSKLDPQARQTFREFVFTQIKTHQLPTLMVTHDSQDIPQHGRCLHWQQL